MSARLSGRVAIVTGAARGIGRAVARRYAREGAVVYAVDVIGEELEAEVEALLSEGHAVHAVPLDVADADAVTALVNRVHGTEAGIDVLANVAGVIIQTPITKTSIDAFDRILNVNLRGTFLLCKAVTPIMISRGRGSVINVSSRAGVIGSAGEVAYCASKFGVEGLSRALARDLEPFGIAVNSITPGTPTHTSMSEITYSAEKRKIWKDPDVLTAAFVSLALQTPAGVHNQYVDAWDYSERLRREGWQ